MKRKILSLALVLVMALTLAPSMAVAAAYTYEEIVPPKYPDMGLGTGWFYEDVIPVRNDNMDAGYIDINGNLVIPFKYNSAGAFKDGMAVVRDHNDKYGIIDKTGKEIVPCKYDYIWDFNEFGYASVYRNDMYDGDLYGIIDRSGKEYFLLNPYFSGSVSHLVNDLFVETVWFGELYTNLYNGKRNERVIDINGNEIANLGECEATEYLGYGYTKTWKNGKTRILDKDFNEAFDLKYDGINPFNDDGLACVMIGENWDKGKKGLIDKTFTEVTPIIYDFLGDFTEGLAPFNLNGKWGYMDATGKEVIAPKYGRVWHFSDGRTVVSMNGKWAVIDKAGKELCEFIYDWINFNENSCGFMTVSLNGKCGVIDSNFQEVVPFGAYDELFPPYKGVVGFVKDGMCGLLKITGTPDAPNLDTASDWARPNITAAIEKGFVPLDIQDNYQNDITRQEFCRMAVMWLEYKLGKSIDEIVAERGMPERMAHTFSDTTDPNILAAYRLGVTSGTAAPTADKPGLFTPNGTFDRQSAATMLRSACKVAGFEVDGWPDAGFADMDSVADWAKPGVNFCRANGIMSGDGTNFNPGELYSRQHSIITFNNIK